VILTSTAFAEGEPMPPECAFSFVTPDRRYVDAPNLNPDLAWDDLPVGTRSLALINDDLDVPTDLSNYGREGFEYAVAAPRRRLCHWVLIDLDPHGPPIGRGEFSDGAVHGGKPGPEAPRGTREGLNEYTDSFARDSALRGDYFGYDGPRPPWNDPKPHRYEFALYALDLARLPIEGVFRKEDGLTAMRGHVLDSTTLTGTFAGHVVK
jgi:Raf kinase inhibitor-like YbhB/YbcL family protein